MKQFIIGVITFLSISTMFIESTYAQEAQEIKSYAKQQESMDWYRKQAKAWKSLVDNNPKDAKAWFNYYKANRILAFRDEENKASEEEKDKSLQDLVESMGKALPNSYEYNFCKWQLGGNDMKYYSYLLKAIDIDPNRIENIDYMINIGEITRNVKQREEYSIKNQKAGQLSTGMIYYNYNQIIGLEKNAILLTAGDNDTYPSWYLQAIGIRKDVLVLNLHLLLMKEYRDKVFSELGVSNLDFDMNSQEEQDNFKRKLVKHLSTNKKGYPVYLAVTSCGHDIYMKDIENQLYLTGLAYVYDTSSVDNMAFLKKNFETQFALDYLDKAFYPEMSQNVIRTMNTNYLIPMLKLYEHYKLSGELRKQQWLKEKILLVAEDTENEMTVLKHLEN